MYAVAFQCDGALVASGGLDALGVVWCLLVQLLIHISMR